MHNLTTTHSKTPPIRAQWCPKHRPLQTVSHTLYEWGNHQCEKLVDCPNKLEKTDDGDEGFISILPNAQGMLVLWGVSKKSKKHMDPYVLDIWVRQYNDNNMGIWTNKLDPGITAACPFCDRIFRGLHTNIKKVYEMHTLKSHGERVILVNSNDKMRDNLDPNESMMMSTRLAKKDAALLQRIHWEFNE